MIWDYDLEGSHKTSLLLLGCMVLVDLLHSPLNTAVVVGQGGVCQWGYNYGHLNTAVVVGQCGDGGAIIMVT